MLIFPNILGLIASDCQTALIMWKLAIWAKSTDTGSTSASGGGLVKSLPFPWLHPEKKVNVKFEQLHVSFFFFPILI